MSSRSEVYRNLHTGTWSLRESVWDTSTATWKKRVVGHPTQVTLRDATMVVQPGGNRRVREEVRKNVHAFIKGKVTRFDFDPASLQEGEWRQLTYNPYERTTFVDTETGEPVLTASAVQMDSNLGVFYTP